MISFCICFFAPFCCCCCFCFCFCFCYFCYIFLFIFFVPCIHFCFCLLLNLYSFSNKRVCDLRIVRRGNVSGKRKQHYCFVSHSRATLNGILRCRGVLRVNCKPPPPFHFFLLWDHLYKSIHKRDNSPVSAQTRENQRNWKFGHYVLRHST